MSAVRLSCVASVLVITLGAAGQPPAPKADAAAIEKAVRQLGDRRYVAREQASKLLWEAGTAAEPALRQALQGGDAETTRRARELLDKFEWGIYPDTPPAVLEQIEHYRGGDDEAKAQAVEVLVKLGKPGYAALVKFAGRAETADARRLLGEALTQSAARAVPLMLLDHDDAAAEALLETSLIGETEGAAAHYAAFMLLRGKLDAALTRWEAEAKARPSSRAVEVLVALYRAKGDYAAARKHAAGHEELLQSLLWEQGDWAELARHANDKEHAVPAFALARLAVYHRLAGDAKAAEADIQALTKSDGGKEDFGVILALLLTERPAEALDRLSHHADFAPVVLDILTSQLRYREALALAEKPALGDDGRPDLLRTLQQARMLYSVGEKDRAGQLFAKLAGGLGATADLYEATELVRTEMRLGLKDVAREHAAVYLMSLARQVADDRLELTREVLESAFPKQGEAARVWWTFLRQKFPHENESAVMKRLRDLLDPPPGAAGPDALAKALLESQPEGKPAAATRAYSALATAYEAAGQFDAARVQLTTAAERSGSGETWLKLGNFLLGRRQFPAAADAYEKAWKSDRSRALPLYLFGWSLTQAGRATEGQVLIEQAHVLPLADVSGRSALARELSDRGLTDLGRRERDLVLRLGWGGSRAWSDGDSLSYLLDTARVAVGRSDFARAADAYERIITSVVDRDGVAFRDGSAYLVVASLARAYRARASLAAGRPDEAMAHARACLDMTPGNIDLAIALVPELARHGRQADADDLYTRIVAPHDGLCKDYSSSALFHNDRAWLAACCRRDLDAALDHAKKSTELEPHNASYRDTLAEVYFQRGDTAKAIELMRECVKAEPRRAYFGQQLRRFEAGDPSVPPPPSDDG